ncbi:hypothetical protein BST61_g7590 [Cercospora zeina]
MGMEQTAKGVVEVPPLWFNSSVLDEEKKRLGKAEEDGFWYRRGQFLVHFAGTTDKVGAIGKWVEALERNRNVLEVEVEETNLGVQVEEFWRGVEERWLQHPEREKMRNEKPVGNERDEERVVDDGRRPKLTSTNRGDQVS